jgi:hypothetical protein
MIKVICILDYRQPLSMLPQTFDEHFLHQQLAGYSLVILSCILINPLGAMLSVQFSGM